MGLALKMGKGFDCHIGCLQRLEPTSKEQAQRPVMLPGSAGVGNRWAKALQVHTRFDHANPGTGNVLAQPKGLGGCRGTHQISVSSQPIFRLNSSDRLWGVTLGQAGILHPTKGVEGLYHRTGERAP